MADIVVNIPTRILIEDLELPRVGGVARFGATVALKRGLLCVKVGLSQFRGFVASDSGLPFFSSVSCGFGVRFQKLTPGLTVPMLNAPHRQP